MATGDGGKIGIDVEVRLDKLQQDLNKAEAKLKQSAAKMSNGAKVNIGVADGLAKAFAIMGTVETGLKGITAVTKLMKGDLEGFDATMRSLPLGIGPVFGAMTDVALVVSGIADKVKEIRGETDKWVTAQRKLEAQNAKRWAEEDAAAKRAKDATAQAQAMTDAISSQLRIAQGKTDEEREQLTINERILALRIKANDIRGAGGDPSSLEGAAAALETSLNAALAGTIANNIKAKADAERDALKAKADAEFALETTLLQARLDNEGKALKARILGITRSRNVEIKAARDAGDVGRAVLLTGLRDAERIAATQSAAQSLMKGAAKGGKAAAAAAIGSSITSPGGFREVQAGRFGFNNVADRANKVQKVEIVKVAPGVGGGGSKTPQVPFFGFWGGFGGA